MSNGPKAFFNQTDLKHVQTTRYLGQKTFRLESSRSEYTAPRFQFNPSYIIILKFVFENKYFTILKLSCFLKTTFKENFQVSQY